MSKPALVVVFVLGAVLASVMAVEVNLVDTRKATTDLNWDTSPSDGTGWNELSNTDENQVPLRTFQVCGIRTPGQNNWFKTNYIELKEGAKNVYVEIKFTIRSCHDISNVATCKETFNLFYLEANSPYSGSDQYMNERVYKKVDTIAADERYPIRSHVTNTKTIKISDIQTNGLYVAFQDTGACMLIYYVRVYYKKCDEAIMNLAKFPSTVTGPRITSLIKVTGKCVTNSIWSDSYEGPTLLCNSEAKWKLPEGSCQCLPGYQPNEEMTECIECVAGQYKSEVGNNQCQTCPDNSLSIKFASMKCICSAGYYRARKDGQDMPCTKPPSKPESVQYTVNETSVTIRWSSPKFTGGRTDITYSISCLRCDSTYSLCSACGDNVDYEPRGRFHSQRHVEIRELSPHTNYRFRIFSYNGVTKISGKDPTFSEILLKTSEAAPSAVGHVRVIDRKPTNVLLNWDSPTKPNGIILEYEIQYKSDGLNAPQIKRINRTKSQTFRIKYLPQGTSFIVQIRAKNAAGYGLFSTPIVFRTLGVASHNLDKTITPSIDEDKNKMETTTYPHTAKYSADNLPIVVGIAISCAMLIVVISALLIISRIRNQNKKQKHESIEIYPYFDNAVDLIQAHREPVKTYIDPSTYGDPDQAVHEFAKEIDSYNIKKEDLLGSGEFGDVYKGLLRPMTPICNDDTLQNLASPFRSTNLVVAIKTLKAGYTEKQKQDFLIEASIMGQFDHPSVIRLEGVVTKTTPLMIVTEFMENGSLDLFLEDRHSQNSELGIFQLVNILRDIADGMKYLSDMGYVHRDLAARNILVNDQLICKVSDFGLSRELASIQDGGTAIYTTKGGMIPVRWTAPEAITQRTFTSSSDVWSFGVVMWEVLTHGERPYWEMPNKDVVHCVENGYRLPPPPFCPRILHNLMLNCWNMDRTRRPTFTQIVAQLDSMLLAPEKLNDTINNIPFHEQAECIPESLDLSSLGQWLEDMNMTQYKDIMLRNGCVTAEQIIRLSDGQLYEMGITDVSTQNILLNGSDYLRERLEAISARGITV
uniref:ephrin type-A receptor 4-like n=1 Tax=Styela clava TaxID=7725 RepID=UPI001939E85D|nr:ephrin type-A receptor 4-like [Styela clava]